MQVTKFIDVSPVVYTTIRLASKKAVGDYLQDQGRSKLSEWKSFLQFYDENGYVDVECGNS